MFLNSKQYYTLAQEKTNKTKNKKTPTCNPLKQSNTLAEIIDWNPDEFQTSVVCLEGHYKLWVLFFTKPFRKVIVVYKISLKGTNIIVKYTYWDFSNEAQIN